VVEMFEIENMETVHEYEYGSGRTITLTRTGEDSCLLYVFQNGEFVESIGLHQIKRLAEIEYDLA